jgi:hypothetical protein
VKPHVLVVLVAATLVAACGATPTPSPATPAPPASPSSVVLVPSAGPSPTPSPSPIPLLVAAIECLQMEFKTLFAGTLGCDEAIAAALAALPQGHGPIVKAAFTYQMPCPPNARCAAAVRLDTGFVIITPKVGGLELVRVVKAANGTISTSGPEAWSPPA